MNTKSLVVILLTLVSGCATEPMTFEESLATPRAMRNDIKTWERLSEVRVSFHYANAAYALENQPEVEVPSSTSRGISVPLAIYDFSLGNDLGGSIGILDWFNSGMSEENTYRYYYMREVEMMATPNTHFISIDRTSGSPTPEELRSAWSEAYKLFEEVYNREGNCKVWGYDDQAQFARTNSKDVPGRYKEVLMRCQHPSDLDRSFQVKISAWAEALPDSKMVIAVQSRCGSDRPRGARFTDDRMCGQRFADAFSPDLEDYNLEWTRLVVTPTEADPGLLEVRATRNGKTVVLPPPEPTEAYVEFLRASN